MSKLFTLAAFTIAFVSIAFGQSEKSAACPKISVTGPAGITQPGEKMIFTSNPLIKESEGVSFRWMVSEGSIEKGQGTQVIEVRTTREMNNSNVTATVEVSGLAVGCSHTASETAAVSSGFHPVILDQFGKLRPNDLRGRLDFFFTELFSEKDQVGVIILQYQNGSSKSKLLQRKQLIETHAKVRRLPRNRIVFLQAPSSGEVTQLYRIPASLVDVICSDCTRL